MESSINTKSGFVTLIGRPNVGKSTLMNRIIGTKVAITSPKPQTTRMQIRTILTEDRGQIVFVDTPGIHKAKNKLGEYMVNVAEKSLGDVDVILWLVEPSTFVGAGEQHIIKQLEKVKIPVFLIINKIDQADGEKVGKSIEAYKDLYDFTEIVPISAEKGTGVKELTDLIFNVLPYGPMYYNPDELTDQPVRQIIGEIIREKALKCLRDEIPHGIAVVIDEMKDRDKNGVKIEDISATIICEKNSHKGMIIGKQGAMLKKIGSASRYEIERLLECKVNLDLWVKVKKDWRDSDFLIKNFGYDKKEI